MTQQPSTQQTSGRTGRAAAPPLRVAMVGHGFMGAAHSQAWRTAPRFFDLPLVPELAVLVGRDPDRAGRAAQRWGWAEVETDWRRAVARDDVDLVDICSPGDSHAEIALAALAAGKHVLCEKPLANTVADAETMARAAQGAAERGLAAMVGFSYRRVPALALAARMVAEGAVGQVRQVRVAYLQDWLSDGQAPMTWRLDKDSAGSGSLGDIGAHAIDAAQLVTGLAVEEVSAVLHTFVTERPLLAEQRGLSGVASDRRGKVTVDDVALVTARMSGGALATFEATRYATGRKNALRLEVSGSEGAVSFDLEDMNVLNVYDRRAPARAQGFTRIVVTEPEHPWMHAWWPTGHLIGYEHLFTHQVADLVADVAAGRTPSPSFAEGLQVQRVLDASERSHAAGSAWTSVAAPG